MGAESTFLALVSLYDVRWLAVNTDVWEALS